MEWLKSQVYHINFPTILIVCSFVIILGKANMKKEVRKIHDDFCKELRRLKR